MGDTETFQIKNSHLKNVVLLGVAFLFMYIGFGTQRAAGQIILDRESTK